MEEKISDSLSNNLSEPLLVSLKIDEIQEYVVEILSINTNDNVENNLLDFSPVFTAEFNFLEPEKDSLNINHGSNNISLKSINNNFIPKFKEFLKDNNIPNNVINNVQETIINLARNFSNNHNPEKADPNTTSDIWNLSSSNYAPGEIIVKFKSGITIEAVEPFLDSLKAIEFGGSKWLNMSFLKVENDQLATALNLLSQNPFVEYAQPNYTIQLAATIPNDPSFSSLWGLNNTGQTGGTADADIDAPEAWETSNATNRVLVGVIDTGIDYTHPDLINQMWTNPGEIAGNGIDDDGNGYIDDIHGYDFVNNDGNPYDDHSHGTHVAGTIAGEANNSLGVTGVAWNAPIELMGLKFLSASGSGTTANAIRAVEYATMMGVDITNNSWGGGGYEQALYDAIAAAGNAGQLFIAAAGNNSSNNDASSFYPANYNLDNIISVAATNHKDQLAWFSNYGATTVDLAAPGENILSTIPGGGYASFNGTSMAAPHVTGAAALLLANEPDLSAEEVKSRILGTVDPITALNGKVATGGRLNLYDMLNPVPSSISGISWHDLNQDGIKTIDEPLITGWTVFIDDNENGILDTGEQSTVTDSNGSYTFSNLDPDTYTIAQVLQSYWQQTSPLSVPDYIFTDSKTGGLVFNWVDIAQPANKLALSGDDSSVEINLPFNFTFYGQTKTKIRVSTNGYLTFGTSGNDFTEDTFPNANNPNDLIAPFWDDLYLRTSSAAYSFYLNKPEDSRFIGEMNGFPLNSHL